MHDPLEQSGDAQAGSVLYVNRLLRRHDTPAQRSIALERGDEQAEEGVTDEFLNLEDLVSVCSPGIRHWSTCRIYMYDQVLFWLLAALDAPGMQRTMIGQ